MHVTLPNKIYEYHFNEIVLAMKPADASCLFTKPFFSISPSQAVSITIPISLTTTRETDQTWPTSWNARKSAGNTPRARISRTPRLSIHMSQ